MESAVIVYIADDGTAAVDLEFYGLSVYPAVDSCFFASPRAAAEAALHDEQNHKARLITGIDQNIAAIMAYIAKLDAATDRKK